MQNKKNQSGAAIILYLLILIVFISVLLVATYSRLGLALKRGQSSSDTLITNYTAESEINDLLARLSGGYLPSPFSLNTQKQIGNTKLTIVGSQANGVQTIEVTASRAFASSKLIAERTLASGQITQTADILLGLDCTESMDGRDTSDGSTRISNLRTAALNFIQNVPANGRFRLGIYVFGIDAKWLQTTSGIDITPNNNLTKTQIYDAVSTKFASTWADSTACDSVMNATSVGTAFKFAHDYFAPNKRPNTKQVEVVITDGDPNSRIPDSTCGPSAFCPGYHAYTEQSFCTTNEYGWSCVSDPTLNKCIPLAVSYLRCNVADKTTSIPDASGFGARDKDVDAYAVTVSLKPFGDAGTVFKEYLGDRYFPAARANELTGILSNILNDIVTSTENIKIRKVLPGR